MKIRSLLLIATSAAAAAVHADVTYNDFSDTSALYLNQNAYKTADNTLRLTDAQNWEGGSAWTTSKQYVLDGFDTSFNYYIGGGNGADGLTFALQNRNLWDLGGLGGSLGFNGITSVFGAQFRTYVHNKIQIGSFTDTPLGSVDNAGLRGDHNVRITYMPGKMSVYFDHQLAVTAAVDLKDYYSDGLAYVGFTAATGGSNDIHEIKDWTFKSGPVSSVPGPAPLTAFAAGLVNVARRRSRRKR